MATSARRLVAPQPPADFATIPLTPEKTPSLVWYRISDHKHASCIYWSRSGVYRFDSPSAKFGVCYAGGTNTASFQEIWGDRIRHRAPIDWLEFETKDVWKIEIPRCSIFALSGANLTTVRATLQCFTGSYKTSQNWGAAFMQHPASLDGLQYIGRRCGSDCVALFGDGKSPKSYQAKIVERRLGPLTQWKGFLP